MKSCLPMSAEKGYEEARILLKERFGQGYKIAAAHLNRLIESAMPHYKGSQFY